MREGQVGIKVVCETWSQEVVLNDGDASQDQVGSRVSEPESQRRRWPRSREEPRGTVETDDVQRAVSERVTAAGSSGRGS